MKTSLCLAVYRGSKRDFFLRLESRKQTAILTTEKVLIISFLQAKYIPCFPQAFWRFVLASLSFRSYNWRKTPLLMRGGMCLQKPYGNIFYKFTKIYIYTEKDCKSQRSGRTRHNQNNVFWILWGHGTQEFNSSCGRLDKVKTVNVLACRGGLTHLTPNWGLLIASEEEKSLFSFSFLFFRW